MFQFRMGEHDFRVSVRDGWTYFSRGVSNFLDSNLCVAGKFVEFQCLWMADGTARIILSPHTTPQNAHVFNTFIYDVGMCVFCR